MAVRRRKRSSSQEMPAFTMTTTFVDEEGNEIRTIGRDKRETSEKESADVSTAEKVIQVISG